MSWQPELDELREREKLAKELGGADKVKRQHDAGKLTIRERIDGLVDKASFHEIGAIAGKAEYDAQNKTKAPMAKPTPGASANRIVPHPKLVTDANMSG